VKPRENEPYSPSELAAIGAACDIFGRHSYERLRARAMILLLRYTALRVSDVALFRRDRIGNRRVYLRTAKNGKPVFLPVKPDLEMALECVPLLTEQTGRTAPIISGAGAGVPEPSSGT
jgi:integrase